MRKRWIMAVPRKKFVVSWGLKVCQLHFSGDDFEHFSCDKQSRVSKCRGCVKLSRLRLESTVVPHIFPTLPNYLTISNPRPRSNNCSSSARLSSERFQKEILPAGYVVFAHDETPFFMPLQIVEDHPGVTYLRRAIDIFKDWQKSGCAALSNETFMAFLPGKIMSEPIEARFAMYRQSNGNFFMSVKQLLLGGKKIRCLSLLQQDGLSRAISISDHDMGEDDASANHEEFQWLADFMHTVVTNDVDDNDASVVFFVSGYIDRSIGRRRNCRHCRCLLIADINNAADLQDCIPDRYKAIFLMADRGGLAEPTEICFAITLLAVQYFSAVLADDDTIKKLMCCMNQRNVFLDAMRLVVSSSLVFRHLMHIKCESGHLNFNLIVQSALNCFKKNHLKHLNSKQNAKPLPQPTVTQVPDFVTVTSQ